LTDAPTEQKDSKRGQIIVAIIGLVGIVVTATFSNWDRLFPKQNLVQATYSGYRPTGNFETEFRYYFDVSGTRQTLELMQRQMLLNLRTDLISKNPNDAKAITKMFDVIEKESIKVEDVLKVLLPIYQKYYTLAEIQELNKFYSTEVMQDMVKKGPLITQDAAPIQMKMFNDYFERVNARLGEEFKSQPVEASPKPTP
jgi:hypothetical protein